MDDHQEDQPVNSKNVEWLKNKLTALWNSPKFCGMCLHNSGNLNSVDMEFVMGRQKNSQSLIDVMNYVFNDDVENIMSSTYVCDVCTEKTLQSYLFIHNTRQLSKIISNSVMDIYSKVVDVGKQVLEPFDWENANIMIVLENDTELYEEIDNIVTVTEIVPTDKPVVKKHITPIIEKPVKVEKNINEDVKTRPVERKVDINKTGDTKLQIRDTSPNISFEKGKIVVKPIKTLTNIPSVPSYTTYKCKECPDIFTTYRSLKEHEKAKHKTQIYECKLCDKSYNTQQYLNLHYKNHSKSRCKICQIILRDQDLFTHLKQTHAHLVHPCKFCDLVYYTQEALDTHFKANHLINNTTSQSQCVMCLKEMSNMELKNHKCKFSCSDCFVMPCIHYNYLIAYREQILKHATKVNCIDCDYITHRKQYLVTHVNREHLDHHPFTCNDCGMQFYTKLSLKNHIEQYHIDNICEYCDEEFKKQNQLYEHRKNCKTTIRTFNCDKCVASFDTNEEYAKHEFLRHSNGGFVCKLCNRRFLEEILLEEHQVTAHSSIQFKKRRKNIECSLCDIKFNNVKELEKHEELHGPNSKYPCKHCDKEFYSLKKLYIHQSRHYDRIACSGCKKRIISVFYPQHAVRCVYKRESGQCHICEVCGKSFHLENLLQAHQKTHMRVDCGECGKTVKASNIQNHMRAHGGINYAADKPVKTFPKIECGICGHMLRKKCDLDAHMNRFHLKVKPYVCHICMKSFCGKTRLNEHLLTHTNSNACYCSICGKKFANKVCLKMHLRIHTGECPYACDLCGEKFRSSSIMKTHRLKKHLDKTVACPSCGTMFHIVREMRHHFKNVHWKAKHKPFNYKEAVPPEYYYLFEDRRLPKVSSDVIIETI